MKTFFSQECYQRKTVWQLCRLRRWESLRFLPLISPSLVVSVNSTTIESHRVPHKYYGVSFWIVQRSFFYFPFTLFSKDPFYNQDINPIWMYVKFNWVKFIWVYTKCFQIQTNGIWKKVITIHTHWLFWNISFHVVW